ncbi:MAG: hypothetical protein AAFV95_10270 [Bacteroidota bacterium]
MKTIHTILLFFALLPVSNSQISTNCLAECLTEKGIKVAKTSAEQASELDETTLDRNNFQEVHYDEEGRVILFKSGPNGPVFQPEYKNGQLQRIITRRQQFPAFSSKEDHAPSIDNASEVIDTAIVVGFHKDREPAELHHADGAIQTFDYNACLQESTTIIDPDGDTVQQHRIIFENGVVAKSIWTPFRQVKSDMVTTYYDYEFNRHGHWIRRKYKDNLGDLVIEKRELTYYK